MEYPRLPRQVFLIQLIDILVYSNHAVVQLAFGRLRNGGAEGNHGIIFLNQFGIFLYISILLTQGQPGIIEKRLLFDILVLAVDMQQIPAVF